MSPAPKKKGPTKIGKGSVEINVTRSCVLEGQHLEAGEPYLVSPGGAKLLSGIGKATIVEKDAKKADAKKADAKK